MKYVMFKRSLETMTQYVPVIFPGTMVHAEIAEALMSGPLRGFEVHSAGETNVGVDGVFDKSETLGVEHDPLDEGRIDMCDYGGCLE